MLVEMFNSHALYDSTPVFEHNCAACMWRFVCLLPRTSTLGISVGAALALGAVLGHPSMGSCAVYI